MRDRTEESKEYYIKNKERINSSESHRLASRRYYQKNRIKIIARKKELPSQSPEAFRRRSLKKNYGLTVEEYDLLLVKQDNVCAICRKVCRTHSFLSIDHCHTTGKIRGLLCNDCNRGIGLLKDNVENIKRSLEYLGG